MTTKTVDGNPGAIFTADGLITCFNAIRSCYAHTLASETGVKPALEEINAIRKRCSRFMSEAIDSEMALNWTKEMWATAGGILAGRDGGFSIGQREFADDHDAHGFTREMADKADGFLREFLVKYPACNDPELMSLFESRNDSNQFHGPK